MAMCKPALSKRSPNAAQSICAGPRVVVVVVVAAE